jgi:putative MFS transporter
MPESPRWLEAHGHKDAAEATLQQMEARVARETGVQLPAPEADDEQHVSREGTWMEIWRPPYLRRTVMLTIFNAFQAIGFYGFAAWVPVLLISEGVEVTKSLTYVLIIALLNPFGSLLAMRFADSFQRKWQIVLLALISAICGLIWAQQRTATGIILLGAAITLANSWFSCSLHAYQTELYPTRIRAQAVGFVYSWSRFSSIFVGFIIAWALHVYGTTGVFMIVATSMLIVALVVGFLGPNSNRMRLETLSQ